MNVSLYELERKIKKSLQIETCSVCYSFTTVICVSSSVSQTRLLESRGTEQSDPAQLSEHTHTPRD